MFCLAAGENNELWRSQKVFVGAVASVGVYVCFCAAAVSGDVIHGLQPPSL